MPSGTNFVGCTSDDNYQSFIVKWHGQKYRCIVENGKVLGEKI